MVEVSLNNAYVMKRLSRSEISIQTSIEIAGVMMKMVRWSAKWVLQSKRCSYVE